MFYDVLIGGDAGPDGIRGQKVYQCVLPESFFVYTHTRARSKGSGVKTKTLKARDTDAVLTYYTQVTE